MIAVADAPAASGARAVKAVGDLPVAEVLVARAPLAAVAQVVLALVAHRVPVAKVAPVVIVVPVVGPVSVARAGMTVVVRAAMSVRPRSRCPR